MAQEKETLGTTDYNQNFSADVSRLLDIVAGALYSNQDVFLRELISNAADACDRLRYEAIQNPELTKDDPKFRIHVFKDTESRTLSIFDNGIGMNADDLAENLGTIAKSGTAKIMEQMKAQNNSGDALKLIGQFGVGFYAGFMVADKIEVISRKAGDAQAWHWESDGRTGFSIREANKEEAESLHGSRGTLITMHIKDSAAEFLIEEKIRHVIEHYSDHIDVPVYVGTPDLKDGQNAVNQASALWARPKNEISEEEYTKFYKHISFGFDDPLLTCHWRAEGKIEFTALLYLPTMRPWDLYDPSRKNAVKLYVRRVFISDSIESLMYPWLRFVRGVIDSEDLPLNISRESLQYNPLITKIRSSVARRILGDLDKLSRNDEAAFNSFWHQFGAALKEGLYDAAEHREDIFKVCRFFSTHDNDKLTSLDAYIERMPEGQDEIYYISGEKVDTLRNSPQIEGFKARGLEVLFFTDTIDEFWLQQVAEYKGKKFQSVTKGQIDLDKFEGKDKKDEKPEEPSQDLQPFAEKLKEILKEEISNIRVSNRLTDSPVCLVAADGAVDMHMERVLKLHQKYEGDGKPVLEINPGHKIIQSFSKEKIDKTLEENAYLLLDIAHILQGIQISDPARFNKAMTKLIAG